MPSYSISQQRLIRPLMAAITLIASGALTFDATADVTYGYDAGGRLISALDSSGTVIRYTYDADGNVIEVSSTSPKTGQPGTTVTVPATPPVAVGAPVPGTLPAPPPVPAVR